LKRPTAASLKRVTHENVSALGADRLARLLLDFANARPELKRQLRMELAALQGLDHLAAEVDKRLTSLETLTSKVSWRQRPVLLRDLDFLRVLVAERMGNVDPSAALDRMWRFMNLARPLAVRVRDKNGELDAFFLRSAKDLGTLLSTTNTVDSHRALADAIGLNPRGWAEWLDVVLNGAPDGLASATLSSVTQLKMPGLVLLVRRLADAAGDVDVFQASFAESAAKEPKNAAEIANRLMAAGRIEDAGSVLNAAKPDRAPAGSVKRPPLDFDWESSFINYLESSGRGEEAQALRWTSFEATLSVERAKAYTRRLKDFDDVDAESRAFAIAAQHDDFQRGLSFLMGWPAVAEAGRMIEARAEDIRIAVDLAELWAPKLRRVKPRAAYLLLRKAAAEALRRREFALCERLTQEAEAIDLETQHGA